MLICTLVTSSTSLPKIVYICWKTNFATMMGCCMLLSLGSESQSTFASPTWIRTRLAVGVLSQQKLQALRPNVIHARRPCRTRARSAIRFWWIAQVGPRRLTAILGPCIFFWICSTPGALGEKIIHKAAIFEVRVPGFRLTISLQSDIIVIWLVWSGVNTFSWQILPLRSNRTTCRTPHGFLHLIGCFSSPSDDQILKVAFNDKVPLKKWSSLHFSILLPWTHFLGGIINHSRPTHPDLPWDQRHSS